MQESGAVQGSTGGGHVLGLLSQQTQRLAKAQRDLPRQPFTSAHSLQLLVHAPAAPAPTPKMCCTCHEPVDMCPHTDVKMMVQTGSPLHCCRCAG